LGVRAIGLTWRAVELQLKDHKSSRDRATRASRASPEITATPALLPISRRNRGRLSNTGGFGVGEPEELALAVDSDQLRGWIARR